MLHHTPGHSPVARTDCKLVASGAGPMCVDVRFNSIEELDDCIRSLQLLREATDFDHTHLQDHEPEGRTSPASTEIVFHLPGSCFDDMRDEMIGEAERRLTQRTSEPESGHVGK